MIKEVEQEQDTMSESELCGLPRSRKLSHGSEPPRSPPGLIRTPSRFNPLRPQPHSEIPSSEEPKVESHDLLVSDDDENWTLQMDDDDEEVIIEGETKITDFIRESFKKEGKLQIKIRYTLHSENTCYVFKIWNKALFTTYLVAHFQYSIMNADWGH